MNLKDLKALPLEKLISMARKEKIETKPDDTADRIAFLLNDHFAKVDMELEKKAKGGDTSVENVRKHKTLGEFKKCIVHLTRHAQANSMVFASIGLYTVEFRPEVEVELPTAIIEFLKGASVPEHVFDADAQSEQGNRGAHVTREAKKYIVEVL